MTIDKGLLSIFSCVSSVNNSNKQEEKRLRKVAISIITKYWVDSKMMDIRDYR